MSRLTIRTENGRAYLVNVKPDEQEVDSPYKNTLQCILDCFERLAQYEDTGLEPDGVKVILDRYVKLRSLMPGESGASVDDGTTLDRLRELVEADRDGRCVVLPCKVGDTVYLLHHVYTACTTPETDYWRVVERTFDLSMLSSVEETVFLTRPEAEVALAEKDAP